MVSTANPQRQIDPGTNDPENPTPRRWARVAGTTIKIVVPLVILAGAAIAAVNLMMTGPKAERKTPVRQAKLVEIQPVGLSRKSVTLRAMGTVTPDREVELKPRVSGQVIWLSDEYLPGGVLSKGQPLLRIDPKDYELVVRQRQADVAKTKSSLKMEVGQQTIALREYEMLGEVVSAEERELVLRGPQLAQVEADLEMAKASLDQAKLNLARTRVAAPFNAVIQSRNVNLGAEVTTATSLANLVGTDSYLIEVFLPVDQLKWVDVPRKTGDGGSAVRIYNEAAWGAEDYRTGRVVRLASELESEGRMAKLFVALDDPLALKEENAGKPVLLVGTFVRAVIEGGEVGPVAAIDRGLLRDGNKLWIMTADEKLEIRSVDILFKGPETVLISGGVRAGDRVITTLVPAPVEGMALRLKSSSGSKSDGGAMGSGKGKGNGKGQGGQS
ncbi:MAG: efflux RND transporter periplasmic adaptor subunit [Rhodospirillales bacterium]|nr:efflux RND transporter periplasmic adaptor subunit [Rhodospirillales bacterium]